MKLFRRLSSKDSGYSETVKKFALRPKRMTNGDIIWLESYEEKRVWSYKPSTIWRTVGYWGWEALERKSL